jgi:uncharacterized protein DUF2188
MAGKLFIERRDEGNDAVRRPDSDRASATEPTQAEAIEGAREIDPDATIQIERVRNTDRGGRESGESRNRQQVRHRGPHAIVGNAMNAVTVAFRSSQLLIVSGGEYVIQNRRVLQTRRVIQLYSLLPN